MVDWSNAMPPGEQLVWQGRPAPRCFTFRRWKSALFGLLLFVLCSWWQYSGWQLAQQGAAQLWAIVPLPFVLLSGYLCCGQLLLARLEWERVFYALTSTQLLLQCGLRTTRVIAIPVSELSYQCLYPHAENLGDLYIEAGQRRLTLCCVEYPHQLYDLLKNIIEQNNGVAVEKSPELTKTSY